MHKPSLTWPNSRTKYGNPISKIRTLIQNLDAELMQLCNQCAIPKGKILVSNSRSSGGNSCRRGNPINMLANEPSSGSQVRTLSSIYRAKVIDAYRNRRIFTVYGNYHTIRRALLRRGWLEKLAPGRYAKLQGLSEDVLLQHAKRGNEYEAVAISKIINHFPSFFIWQPKGQRDLCADVLPLRNRVRRGRNLDFSTKVGLVGCAEQEQWFTQEGVSGMRYPRVYRLGRSYEERMKFIEDFRQTQCSCLLRYVTENINHPEELIDQEEGSVSVSILDFALFHVKKHLSELEHNTLDEEGLSNTENEIVEWQSFMTNSNEILQKTAKFRISFKELTDIEKTTRSILAKLEEACFSCKWDGCRNLWILKPGYQCRGNGIIIRSSLDDILQWTSNNLNRRYIAQKYVERPLLIYKTKFDIRQYMLLSIGEFTASIWLYRDCYLRFSSQEFSIDDLRESIHLTNNSVQKRYKNKQNRDARLPKNNMWSLEQFKAFLKYVNGDEADNIWEKKIYAGFKENLIAVVLASFEETEFIQNAFELYGCDFMLDEQYNPILIEINSTPDLTPSTEVTARICPMALKDLVKVIVDLPRTSRATTGLFELVYEVNYRIKKDFDAEAGLEVNGAAMTIFRPIRPPNKTNFFRKPNKIIKKAENAIKSPLKKLKNKSNAESSNKGTIADDCTTPLKSITKEALALHYTIPK